MDRYKAIPKTVQLCANGAGIIASKFATDWLSKLTLDMPVVLVLAVIVFAVASKAIQTSFDFVFDHLRILRRILLGRTYVEGKWVETILRDNKVVCIGLSEFRPEGYGISFSGAVFDFDGYQKAIYSADIADLHWPKLYVKHSHQPSVNQGSRLEGYGELQFDYRPGKALTYRGFFTHLSENIRYSVVATKMIDKHKLKLLNDTNTAKALIKAKAQEILAEYQPSADAETNVG